MVMTRHKRAQIYKAVVQIYVSTIVSRRSFHHSILMSDSCLTQLIIATLNILLGFLFVAANTNFVETFLKLKLVRRHL